MKGCICKQADTVSQQKWKGNRKGEGDGGNSEAKTIIALGKPVDQGSHS
jgi:hypothetical protein